MFHWFETIKITDGKPGNLWWHKRRVAATLQMHKLRPSFNLPDFIHHIANKSYGIYRLRIDYNSEILAYSLKPYIPGALNSLKLVTDNHIDYSFKMADRSRLDELRSKKGLCDDVLIIKEGRITDISYANILFTREKKFFTPSSPLLAGTKLNELLTAGIVHPVDIRPGDLKYYDGWLPVNALLDFRPEHIRPIASILD